LPESMVRSLQQEPFEPNQSIAHQSA
jgi:hypothetical protein